MEIKILKSELYRLHEAIVGSRNFPGVMDIVEMPFSYRVKRTKDRIESILKASEKLRLIPVEYHEKAKAFDTDRRKLAEKMSKKDEKGNPVTDQNGFVIEDMETFNIEFEKVKEAHKEAYEQIELANERYMNDMESEVVLDVFSITEDQLPSRISARQIDGIDFMIDTKEKDKDSKKLKLV